MGYWNSRGLRGSVFEEMINLTNEQYEKRGIALIQKIPTPIIRRPAAIAKTTFIESSIRYADTTVAAVPADARSHGKSGEERNTVV